MKPIQLDYGQRATERAYANVRRRLERNYQQAITEVREKMEHYAQRFKANDEKYRQMVKDGKMTQQDYESWLRGQVFRGNQWRARQVSLTETLYNADTISQKIVNGDRLDVFAQNANYMGYSLEHGGNINAGFTLYDGNMVAKLLKDEPNLLPPRKVKHKEDVDWYHKIINNCVTQGIIQGESIRDIAKRIAETTGERGMNAALRNARTAYTAAQNAGRIEAMHQAERLGIKVQKQWEAILDGRTRQTHRDLDGQVANVDEPFESDLGDIMFPGDPNAAPENVWNCRCSLVYYHPEYPSERQRRDAETGEIVGNMTYREWEEWKNGNR